MKTMQTFLIRAFIIMLAAAACSGQQKSPAEIKPNSPKPSDTLAVALTASDTATKAPTDTQLPTSTFTATATYTATPSPTITLTPTAQFNLPGYYPVGGCASYKLPPKPPYNKPVDYYVDFCVISVTIKTDLHMVFTVSWTTHLKQQMTIIKNSDEGNRNMYVIDNLGNRYNQIAAGGDATKTLRMGDGDTATGWFEYPPPHKGAKVFTFVDNDQNVSISGITFVAPVVITGTLGLNWYDLALEYLLDLWEPGKADDGGSILTHTQFTNCQLQEWEPSEPQGTYLNTITLGGITYEIYGWYEAEWSVREYVAIEGYETQEANTKPLFRATIPYEDSLQCIFDISEVLATLHSLEQ